MRSSVVDPRPPSRLLILAVAALLFAGCATTETFPRRTPPSQHSAAPTPVAIPAEMWVTNPSGPVITPEQATAMVRAFWPLRSKALAEDDARTISALETGPAAEHDLAVTTDDLARPHLPPLRRVVPLLGLVAFVPLQTSYPASFMAEVQTTVYGTSPDGSPPGTGYIDVLVFTRPDRGTPWLLTLTAGFVGSDLNSLLVTRLGSSPYDRPPASRYAVDPQTVPGLYIVYRQRIADSGIPPASSVFEPGYWTTKEPVRHYQRDQEFLRDTGIRRQLTFSVDLQRDGFFQFTVNEGSDLACFVLRYLDLSVPPRGRFLTQTASRDEWGGWLAPGRYSRITTRGRRQMCAIIPLPGAPSGVGIMGGDGGFVAVDGDPAH